MKVEPGMYAYKVSPNGLYIANASGDAAIYDVQTGEMKYYEEVEFGIGNSIDNNGNAVGSIHDTPALIFNGEVLRPQNYIYYWFVDYNAVTPDGSRLAGLINNTSGKGVMYVPFVADIDANGNVSDPVILPYPDRDLFKSIPQWVSATWISDDGRTVGGQVMDSYGSFTYPIVFQQDNSGNWDYILPSESTFNPNGINIPADPYLDEPTYPEAENFMSGALLQAYLEAVEAYQNGYADEPPVPEAYMTDEQYQAYADAVNAYNDWYYEAENYIKEFSRVYWQILSESPTFALNDTALRPDGTEFCQMGGVVNEDGEMVPRIYRFNIPGKTFEVLENPKPTAAPKQVLPNGTLIVSTGVREVPTSWILLPGSTEFLTVPEFLEADYPEIAQNIKENFGGGTGIVCSSYDMTVMAGGMTLEDLTNYDDEGPYYFYSYILTDLAPAGVESLVAEPEDGVYRVYNLQGLKMLETKNVDELNSLPKGIYVVNNKKIKI